MRIYIDIKSKPIQFPQISQLCRSNGYFGPHYISYTRTDTHLVMAGLEGAPRAVESHLNRRQGQIGHIILTTLCVIVLHLEERTE